MVYVSLIWKILQGRKLQAGAIRLSTVLACEVQVICAFLVTTQSRARTMSVYLDMATSRKSTQLLEKSSNVQSGDYWRVRMMQVLKDGRTGGSNIAFSAQGADLQRPGR